MSRDTSRLVSLNGSSPEARRPSDCWLLQAIGEAWRWHDTRLIASMHPLLSSSLPRTRCLAWCFTVLAALGAVGCSANGDEATGAAGQASSQAEAPVESRTSEIPTYNSQASALTIADLCRVLIGGSVALGEATVTCTTDDGVTTLSASKGDLTASVLANASDKLVLEYRGDDESHEYKNNRGQTLLVRFDFTTSGTRRTADGTYVDGSFRADLLMGTSEGNFRFGYYFNQKLP